MPSGLFRLALALPLLDRRPSMGRRSSLPALLLLLALLPGCRSLAVPIDAAERTVHSIVIQETRLGGHDLTVSYVPVRGNVDDPASPAFGGRPLTQDQVVDFALEFPPYSFRVQDGDTVRWRATFELDADEDGPFPWRFRVFDEATGRVALHRSQARGSLAEHRQREMTGLPLRDATDLLGADDVVGVADSRKVFHRQVPLARVVEDLGRVLAGIESGTAAE